MFTFFDRLPELIRVVVKVSILLCILLIFATSGCQSVWKQPFPDAEIVYQTGSFDQPQLGFVRADGSNPVLLETGVYLMKTTWSLAGDRIYALSRGGQAIVFGYPAYWEPDGKFKKCREWFNYEQIEEVVRADGSKQALILSTKVIQLADLDRCKSIEVLVDIFEHGELIIFGASYSPDGRWLLYGLETGQGLPAASIYQLMKMDLKTHQAVELAKGVNPSWSPDGLQIAYVQADGIYIMNADGSQPRQVVNHIFVNEYGNFGFPPILRWSPDGKWIVYHRCEKYSCIVYENTIYKVETATGKEVKIIEGGAFPDWRR